MRQHRRSVRLPAFDYAAPGAYFLTIVAQDRACIFGHVDGEEMQSSPQGRIAAVCWQAIPDHFPNAELGTYVVMPNHAHGIIVLHDRPDARASERRGTIYRAPTANDADLIIGAPPTIEQYQKPVAGSIPTIIRTYKAAVTRLIVHDLGGAPRIWQRNYYEHVVRDDADWDRIHRYIETNLLHWAHDEENPVFEPDAGNRS